MKALVRWVAVRFCFGILLLGPATPCFAAFNALYVLGDCVCSTTDGPGGSLFYGGRYTNGRTWVEVLSQWQGLTYDQSKNDSFYGHYAPIMVGNALSLTAPADASNALFAIWVNDADFVYNIENYGLNLILWTNAMNRSLSNHLYAVQTLYGKGFRTFIMPNAVDVAKVPYYNGLPLANRNFIRARILEYNAAFSLQMELARTNSGITVYEPDFFNLMEQIFASPSSFGVTNALYVGRSIDALEDPALPNKALNGPGANYIFWEYEDPTAKVHMWMADVAQRLLPPVQFADIERVGASNRLDMINLPVGRAGYVEASTNFVDWTSDLSFTNSALSQSVYISPSTPLRFYRLRFPFSWIWP